MLYDAQYLYTMIPALLLSLWANWRVKTNFAKGMAITARCGEPTYGPTLQFLQCQPGPVRM